MILLRNCSTFIFSDIPSRFPNISYYFLFFQDLILPRIGQPSEGRIGTCLIENTWGFLFYIYIISGTSILLSVIFFGLFVWNLFFGLWSKDNQRIVEESSVKNQFDNASVRLQAAIRVFFTLGLIWVCDIASWSLRWR